MNNGFIFNINQRYANLNFINDTGEKHTIGSGEKWSHYPILHRVLNFMRDRGFEIGRDPRIQKHYKCLNKDHWYGKKGALEFRADRYPRGFKIEFFQNIVFENPHGGYYDFDKYDKMPYLIKLIFRNEMRHIKQFLEQLGCLDDSTPVFQTAIEKIKYDYVHTWNHPQKSMDEFELSDLDGQTCQYSYNNTDRDKKTIFNGQIKYFRHWNGRLMRGKVYHNMNNMWWVILNQYAILNKADFELFDPTPEDFKARRLKADRKPKEYLEKVTKIKEASNKELINELKRRGLKVSV